MTVSPFKSVCYGFCAGPRAPCLFRRAALVWLPGCGFVSTSKVERTSCLGHDEVEVGRRNSKHVPRPICQVSTPIFIVLKAPRMLQHQRCSDPRVVGPEHRSEWDDHMENLHCEAKARSTLALGDVIFQCTTFRFTSAQSACDAIRHPHLEL